VREVDLKSAVELLQRGEVLIYPTETLYGLGVDIANEASLYRLFRLKGRDPGQPISVLVPNRNYIEKIVKEIDSKSLILIEKYFPGSLTLVLRAASQVSPLLHAGTGWIGIRMSSHPLAEALVKAFGRPITTTSANPSGQESGRTLQQVKDYFQNEKGVALLPGGDLPTSKGSTVVKMEGDVLKLLREGEIPFTEIESVFNA
jgi:L-threonylcarbamoyladenylate synthase